MKSSIKFREEKSPLLRMKLPFNLGPIPLSSGIAVGTKQDLAVHLATGFPAGPIIKLAIKPHDPNPLSVILKAGLGFWGSPSDAPLTLTAEIFLTPNGCDRLLSLRLKPRAGDFSIRKVVKNVNFFPAQQKAAETTSVRLQLHENNEQNRVITPHKVENDSVFNSLLSGDAKPSPKHISGNCLDKENVRSPSVDSSTVVAGSNISQKIEGLEKGRNDRKPKLEVLKEQDVEADGNSMIVHVPHEMLHGRKKLDSRKLAASFSFAGAQDAIRGCKVVTHSSLPLGSQARLNVRWGVKSAPDFFQGWDEGLPSLSFSKLPSLVIDKVSLEQIASPVEKPSMKASGPTTTGSYEQGLLPVSFVEENRELAQVASMCYAMKRQLHLMHAENLVLRRAMEEMSSHVESKGSWISNGVGDSMLTNSQPVSKLPHKSSFLDVPPPPQQGREGSHRDTVPGREANRRDAQAQKVQKVKPKKDEEFHSKSKFPADDNIDVSKELERAILNAQIGPAAGKKE